MKTSEFGRYALSISATAALLTGCGGSQRIAGPGAVAQRSALATHAGRGESWMSSDASQGGDLLYVSVVYSGVTNVYTYPGGKLVGGLSNTGYTNGLCSTKSGDVFITTQYAIYEYPHARAVPIAVLTDPQGEPFGCSADPTTGKLAAASLSGIAIYRPAPDHQWYLPRLFNFRQQVASCGYDADGNLFVDGKTNRGKLVFVELPKGGSRFENVSLNQDIADPGNIEWDGKYLAVGDEQNLLIRRFLISGRQGVQVGSLTLTGALKVQQFWIQGTTLIGPAFESGWYAKFWRYPKGGPPTGSIQLDSDYGATVSVPPQ